MNIILLVGIFLGTALAILIPLDTPSISVSEGSKNKTIQCVDTRDGEEFQFNTNDITNITSKSFEVKDINGKRQVVGTTTTAPWLKCEAVLDALKGGL